MSETSAAEQAMSMEMAAISNVIKRHQKVQSCSRGRNPAEQVNAICEEYQRSAEDAVTSANEFRDRMCVDIRALNLIVTSCLNSETHKEKDAHLRILSKLLGSCLEWLRQSNWQSVWSGRFYFNRDPFQCDWPVREMKNRIYELEKQVQDLTPKEPKNNTKPAEPYETESS